MLLVTAQQPGPEALFAIGPVLPVAVIVPSGGRREVLALVDTGSTISSVDHAILTDLGASVLAETTVQTIQGEQVVPVYAAGLATADGVPLVPADRGVLGDSLPAGVRALLGRDTLQGLVLAYDGREGSWSLQAYEGQPGAGISPWLFWGSVAALAAGGALLAYGVGRREYRLGREAVIREEMIRFGALRSGRAA